LGGFWWVPPPNTHPTGEVPVDCNCIWSKTRTLGILLFTQKDLSDEHPEIGFTPHHKSPK
jgi:hypothetical protein